MVKVREPVTIIDAHQHFWGGDDHAHAYTPEDYLRSAAAAPVPVAATVFAECLTAYDMSLPEDLRATGETRFAAQIGEQYATASTRLASAIIAHADPVAATRPFTDIVAAHQAASGGRLRGFRRSVAWDEDESLNYAVLKTRPRLLADPKMREAAAVLGELGLVFETWLYHPQIPELGSLARAVPQGTFVLDHAGTPLAAGRHKDNDPFPLWRDLIAELAEAPNVHVKIGGMVTPGGALDRRRVARSLARWTRDALAEELDPWIAHLLLSFGPERCLFESNFPVDAACCDFDVLVGAYLDMLPQAACNSVMSATTARLYAIGSG